MKKHYHTLLAALMILIVGGLILTPGVVSAETSIIEEIAVSGINNALAAIANFLLGVTAWFVAITGTLLNVSIIITMRIKDLYTEIDSIRMVWVTIRDLSSIFIIFLLLYAAIKMILGVSSSDFGKLVVKIFLAGIFINFSLFFVKVAVDASNLVSLQFYNAIAPGTSRNMEIGKAFSDGGISNVFMQSLQLPKIYQNKDPLKSTDIFSSIALAAIGGMILMVTAAFSFLAAALAFIARTGILLFVMALSPILVIGIIFPEVKSKFKTLFDVAVGQLVFMPAYLGLMYVALRFISDPKFTNIFNPAITGTAASQNAMGAVSIGVIIQYTIAIIFINAPLVAAISLSGTKGFGMSFVPQGGAIGKWFTGNYGKKPASFAGQQTLGRWARGAAESIRSSEFAVKNPGIALYANKKLGKVAGAAFGGEKGGYEKRYKEYVKTRSEFGNKLEISDEKKREYVEAQMPVWDKRSEELQKKIDSAKTSLANPSRTAEEKKKLQKIIVDSAGELSARNKAEEDNKTVEYLEGEALKKQKETYATNVEKGGIVGFKFVTREARKEAAKAIRKEFKKGKADKILKDLAKELEGDKDKGDEAKPDAGKDKK